MSKLIKLKKTKIAKKNSVESLPTWEEIEQNQCSHCGGAHLRACPRVKRMTFNASGTLHEIEFWQDKDWDKSNILWPESIVESGDNNE